MRLLRGGLLLGLALLAAPTPVRAEDKDPLAALSGAAALGIAKELSTDVMLGRRTGFAGGRLADNYVAQAMGEMGLDPKDPAGTYLDPFEFAATQVKAPIAFSIGGQALEYGTDYLDLVNSGQGQVVEAEVVFVGYGISAPTKSFDEYAGVDVKGKVVLALAGVPRERVDELAEESRLGAKSALAHERGAKAFLVAHRDRAFAGLIAPQWLRPAFPALSVSSRTADHLLEGAKTTREAEYDARFASKAALAPVNTGAKVTLDVRVEHLPRAKGHHALGAIRGSDADLRREVVLVGAPMDHLGVDAQGRVRSGAKSSASGIAVVLHVARTLVEASWKPKRMVLFVAFGASAQGNTGAEGLAEALPFEHDGIVCMIHVAHVGQRKAKSVLAGRDGFPEMGSRLSAYLPEDRRRSVTLVGPLAPRSEPALFAAKGVPAFHLTSVVPPDSDDDPEQLESESLEAAAKVLGALVVRLGEEPEPLKARAKPPEAPR